MYTAKSMVLKVNIVLKVNFDIKVNLISVIRTRFLESTLGRIHCFKSMVTSKRY